jgi:hypothetical protein
VALALSVLAFAGAASASPLSSLVASRARMMADPMCKADPLPCATAQLTRLNGKPVYHLIMPVALGVSGNVWIHTRNDSNYYQLWANECHSSSGWSIC